eukprot:GEZU01013269.1.p1 GENE.GEZU01013269.1~~GEZU01013269.1.p1  ORF type:complete len:559 (-),score=163.21 GEZU01013269.1:266-1942(-)
MSFAASRFVKRAPHRQLFAPLAQAIAVAKQQKFHTANTLANKQLVQHIEKTRAVTRDDFDFDHITFPRERHGLDYDLNWSLSEDQINPYFDSFRNLDTKGLIARSYVAPDKKTKAIVVDAKAEEHENTAPANYYVNEQQDSAPTKYSAWNKDIQKVTPKIRNRIYKELAYHLSNVPSSFVFDAAVGSSPATETTLRVVTDDPISGIYLNHMLLKVPKRKAVEFKDEAIILHCPGYRFTPTRIVEEFGGPTPADLGLTADKFVLTDLVTSTAMTGGVADRSIIQDTLAFLAARNAFAKNALTIPSDAVFSESGELTLVLNNPRTDIANVLENKNLYGAHHNIWSAKGVSRLWDGVSKEYTNASDVDAKLDNGYLVEKNINNSSSVRLTRPLPHDPRRPNVVKHPKRLVILINDKSGATLPALSRVSAEEAVKLFTTGLTAIGDQPEFAPAAAGFSANFTAPAHPDLLGKLFTQLLQDSGAEVYVANSANKNVAAEVDRVISGQVSSASTKAVNGLSGWEQVSQETSSFDGSKLASAINEQYNKLRLPEQTTTTTTTTPQ